MTKEEQIISIKKQLSDAVNYIPSTLDLSRSSEGISLTNQTITMKALFLLLDDIKIE